METDNKSPCGCETDKNGVPDCAIIDDRTKEEIIDSIEAEMVTDGGE